MSDTAETVALPTKLDPETLVLRGAPVPAVRFRRGIIVGLAALGSTAIVGVTWMALRPMASPAVEIGDTVPDLAKPAPDALAAAPRTYGDVPKLGPPLPGDLGRPILEHQQAMGTTPATTGVDATAQAAEMERQRVEAERKAARESGVMLQVTGGQRQVAASVATTASEAVATPASAAPERIAFDPDRDPNAQQRKADFLGSKDASSDLNPHALSAAVSPYTLMAGTVISASLITGLNSDLPGLVIAQVTENAYDTVTGRILLIPQGSRLIGSYDSVVAYGQKRALVVWQRIVLPDGSSVRIDNVPATDTAGYAGLADKVDVHTWQLLKGVALSSLLGVGTQLSLSGESDLVQALRESTQQSAAQAGQQIVGRSLNIQPSITVRPGWPLRVVVHKDIVLRPWSGQGR